MVASLKILLVGCAFVKAAKPSDKKIKSKNYEKESADAEKSYKSDKYKNDFE